MTCREEESVNDELSCVSLPRALVERWTVPTMDGLVWCLGRGYYQQTADPTPPLAVFTPVEVMVKLPQPSFA